MHTSGLLIYGRFCVARRKLLPSDMRSLLPIPLYYSIDQNKEKAMKCINMASSRHSNEKKREFMESLGLRSQEIKQGTYVCIYAKNSFIVVVVAVQVTSVWLQQVYMNTVVLS